MLLVVLPCRLVDIYGRFIGLLKGKEGAMLSQNVGKIFASLWSTEDFVEIAGSAEQFEMLQGQLGAVVG